MNIEDQKRLLDEYVKEATAIYTKFASGKDVWLFANAMLSVSIIAARRAGIPDEHIINTIMFTEKK